MKINTVKQRPGFIGKKNTATLLNQFRRLTEELLQMDLSPDATEKINREIHYLNTLDDNSPILHHWVLIAQSRILQLLQKECQLVPKNYYRNSWMATGTGFLGLLIGLVIALSTRNMGLIAAGLPVGMIIGRIAGRSKDGKAAEAGKLLSTEIKIQ